jgi:hypothetical protein
MAEHQVLLSKHPAFAGFDITTSAGLPIRQGARNFFTAARNLVIERE